MSRQFSDKESAAILRRAVELQAQEVASGYREGTSLAQLEAVGAELGVSADAIRRASEEIELQSQRGAGLRGPAPVVVERQIPHRFREEDWPLVVERLRQHTGRPGEVGRVGPGFEWSTKTFDQTRITVIPSEQGTFVRGTANPREWSEAAVVLSGLAGLMMIGATSNLLLAMPVFVAVSVLQMLVALWAGQAILRRLWQAKYGQLNALLNATVNALPPTVIEQPRAQVRDQETIHLEVGGRLQRE